MSARCTFAFGESFSRADLALRPACNTAARTAVDSTIDRIDMTERWLHSAVAAI
jgi:hypothetical protein